MVVEDGPLSDGLYAPWKVWWMKLKTNLRCLHFSTPKGPKTFLSFISASFLCVRSFPSWQVTKQVILARLCFSKLFIELTPSCNCYRRAISQVTSLRIPFSFISSIRYYVTFECSDSPKINDYNFGWNEKHHNFMLGCPQKIYIK